MPQTKIMSELEHVLRKNEERYFLDGILNKARVIEDLHNYEPKLITLLGENEKINKHFMIDINGNKVIKINELIEVFEMNEYWDDSYTAYENKIGLTSRGKFISDNADVILDFPYKDTVLKASMSKEEREKEDLLPEEPFLNEKIAREEIDILLDKKVLVNATKYNHEGNQKVSEFSEGDNLILKGNNLLALHTLKDKFASKIKIIYIDPPYNTGNDGFDYNDNFNHSSWLAFMKSRLEIARELLQEDGLLFVSLDDKEAHYLKVLADDIFGRENFIADIAHKSRASISNDKIISANHNHLLLYAKNERKVFEDKHLYGVPNKLDGFNLKDENGDYKLVPVDGPGGARKGNPYYEFMGVEGYWRFSKTRMQKMYDEGLIVKTQNNLQQKYYKENAAKKKRTLTTWWDENFLTSTATLELKKLFGDNVFNNPKNEYLLRQIIEFGSREGDIILDFFMGSATTQAVAHKMSRRYIGIEQMDYIKTISIPRLRKVIEGEQGGISGDVDWQGGGSFIYAELMEKNTGYLKDILEAESTERLREVFNLMLEYADFDFRIDLEEVKDSVWKLSLENQKRTLIKIIDKNQLYYNYSEIDDENVRDLVSDSDYAFNESLYDDTGDEDE